MLPLSASQSTFLALSAKIKRLNLTIERKDDQLVKAHQINYQLQLRIRELEKCLESENSPEIRKDSHNSNLPPSLDLPWKKPKRTRSLRKTTGCKVGGQPGHKGVTLLQVASPDRIIVHSRDACQHCGASLFEVEPRRFHKRQVFEIEDGKLLVTEHRAPAVCCPVCCRTSFGQFPANVKAPVQYGTGVFSRLLYLHLYQLLPVARTAETMRDLFDCPVSPATVQRAAQVCSGKLVRCEQRIKAAIRDSAVIGADETGIRIGGATAWVHVARTDALTHLAAHSQRGKAAIETIGILNRFEGTLVRDGWFSYNWYQQCRHSLCNAHLLRDLTFIEESDPRHEKWATSLARLLIEIKDAVGMARSQFQTQLASNIQTDFLNRYDAVIAAAERSIRGSPEVKNSGLTPHALYKRLTKNKAEILRFMFDFSVPFDNNGSERDLRMLKLQQKISGCFRTVKGVTTFCRIRSYLSSVRKQGGSLLAAIEHALLGKPVALTD
jgi:transposase